MASLCVEKPRLVARSRLQSRAVGHSDQGSPSNSLGAMSRTDTADQWTLHVRTMTTGNHDVAVDPTVRAIAVLQGVSRFCAARGRFGEGTVAARRRVCRRLARPPAFSAAFAHP